MRKTLLILSLVIFVSTSFSQEVETKLFSGYNFLGLLDKPISDLPQRFSINKSITDSLPMEFIIYKIYGQIMLDTQYFVTTKFRIKDCFLSVNKQNIVSAIIFRFNSDVSTIRDSLVKVLGVPTVKFSNNFSESFGLEKKTGDWYWKFPMYAISILMDFNNSQILMITNLKPDDYLKSEEDYK